MERGSPQIEGMPCGHTDATRITNAVEEAGHVVRPESVR
jgi:hypothetical protein